MLANFKAAGEGEHPLLPDGAYLVTINSWKKIASKGSSNEQVEWSTEVNAPAEHMGASLREYHTLTESALWRLSSFLGQVLQFDVSSLPPIDTDAQEFKNLLDACVGRKVYMNIFTDTYNGKTKNKTTTKDPYAPAQGNPGFDPASIEDVPSWVKRP